LVEFQKLLSRYALNLQRAFDVGSHRQLQGLLQRKLPMGYQHGATGQQEKQPQYLVSRARDALGRVLSLGWYKSVRDNLSFKSRNGRRAGASGLSSVIVSKEPQVSKVYDLVDCGPRSRFVIRNDSGEVFISHNSAGHGLNLQQGGSMIIWFAMNWSLELYQQFNARLHRQGQEKPVRIVHMIVSNTIDERVMSVLASKDTGQSALLNALKPKGK
jgi:hypothetical protein